MDPAERRRRRLEQVQAERNARADKAAPSVSQIFKGQSAAEAPAPAVKPAPPPAVAPAPASRDDAAGVESEARVKAKVAAERAASQRATAEKAAAEKTAA